MLTRKRSVGISTSNLDTDPLGCLSCLLLSSFRLAAPSAALRTGSTSRLATCAPQDNQRAAALSQLYFSSLRLFLCCQFLKARIVADLVPDRIEPQQRGSN